MTISRSTAVSAIHHHHHHLSQGSTSKSVGQCSSPTELAFSSKKLTISSSQRRVLAVQATYSDDRGSSGMGSFVGGFILGGLIVGPLGCVYAPQISKALSGATAGQKDLMKKLPKFVHDEEKALEKQRKKLEEKIGQLNSAIDNVSSQLKSEQANK